MSSTHDVRRLSFHLRELAESARSEDLTLGSLMDRLEGRVYTLLFVLLSLPFCQPVALPGLSTPFGVVLALLGLRFAFRQKPWLPKRLLRIRVPSRFVPSVLQASSRLLSFLERFLHPRGTFLYNYRATQVIAGIVIFSCGLLLLLPLPIPLSNLLPALTIVLLAASFSERDAGVLFAGFGVHALTVGFFILVFFGGVEFAKWIEMHLDGFFDPDYETLEFSPSNL